MLSVGERCEKVRRKTVEECIDHDARTSVRNVEPKDRDTVYMIGVSHEIDAPKQKLRTLCRSEHFVVVRLGGPGVAWSRVHMESCPHRSLCGEDVLLLGPPEGVCTSRGLTQTWAGGRRLYYALI